MKNQFVVPAKRNFENFALRDSILLVLGILLLGSVPAASGAETAKVPMTADRWQVDGTAEFQQYKGVEALLLKKGVAVLKDLTFRDGTIEFDAEPTGSMGAGIGFRRRDKDTYEDFYLRPRPKCSEAVDCVQYAPQTHGVLLWDMFPQYQAPAPVQEGEWNHIKLVVSGRRMNIYINGAKSPTLKVSRLEGDVLEGGLLLQAPGNFANLTVTPNAVEGLTPEPEKDVTANDVGLVRNWQVAPFYELATDKEPTIAELPGALANWQPLEVERGGLLNITRLFGLPLTRPARAVTWVKTTIRSDKSQVKNVTFGWSREVWVFVNGKRVFADKNLYQPPTARKTPDGRLSLENGSFELPLKAGENEIAIAIANNFYGWGLILRLDDVKGVRMAVK